MFLLSRDGNVGELLELHQGCQGPFQATRGKVGFLSRHCSRKGPHLALRGESPGFSRVAAGNMVFLLSYDEDLRDWLCGLRKVLSPCEMPGNSRVSSPVGTGS